MMDRKTTLVMVGCLIALLLSQAVINKMYPPKPKAAPPITAAATNLPASTVEVAPSAGNPTVPTTVSTTEPGQPRVAEQIVTLSNEFVRVDFTSWGGGVR